ncbi:uncharacterized protein DMAD_13789 [Drosophila madeirensis]|uniref:Uncharacterized protein n=1 Tax=Drosophila madeirensis TaxID=30013 RepID=A0AAU9G4J6_DROMD
MFGKRRRDHERDQERNNNMYHRLCQTLAAEHQKLRDLELRREKLMEEMRILRALHAGEPPSPAHPRSFNVLRQPELHHQPPDLHGPQTGGS